MLEQHAGFTVAKMVYGGQGGKTARFRGYAFAYFDTVANATAAKDSLAGLILEGREVNVKYANPSQDLVLG